MKRLWMIVVLVVILAAVLMGCGSGEEEGVTLKPVGISHEEEQAASAGLIDDFDGLMAFVKGSGLYFYDPASGQDPVFVTDELDPWTISLSPGRDKLVYETGDYDDGQIQVFDAATRQARAVPVQLGSRAAETWGVAGWSPDEQWIISFLWPIGQEAVRLDGGASHILTEFDRSAQHVAHGWQHLDRGPRFRGFWRWERRLPRRLAAGCHHRADGNLGR